MYVVSSSTHIIIADCDARTSMINGAFTQVQRTMDPRSFLHSFEETCLRQQCQLFLVLLHFGARGWTGPSEIMWTMWTIRNHPKPLLKIYKQLEPKKKAAPKHGCCPGLRSPQESYQTLYYQAMYVVSSSTHIIIADRLRRANIHDQWLLLFVDFITFFCWWVSFVSVRSVPSGFH